MCLLYLRYKPQFRLVVMDLDGGLGRIPPRLVSTRLTRRPRAEKLGSAHQYELNSNY